MDVFVLDVLERGKAEEIGIQLRILDLHSTIQRRYVKLVNFVYKYDENLL